MPLDPRLLRKPFAVATVVAVLVAAGFYLRSIVKDWRQPTAPHDIPTNLEQIAKEFTFSKSEGGRTLFTIRAASFEQFKAGERYELHDTSITLYGRGGDRSDHIYGSDFQYDRTTGDVKANGEVQMDLQADSPVAILTKPDARPAARSVIHLKTSGLTFNEKSGLAQTNEAIEFRVPDAIGSAVGAVYDSQANALALKSAVKIVTTGKQKATVTGKSANILKSPQRIIVQDARMEQPPRAITTDKLTVLLRDNSTVERILGEGNVHALRDGPKGFDLTAPMGELLLDDASQLHSGSLSGGVAFTGAGQDSPPQGRAGHVSLAFGDRGVLEKVRAEDSVLFKQGPAAKSQEVQAAAIDLYVRGGKVLEKAVTSSGPAQVVLTEGTSKSTISAGQLDARFDEQNHLKSILGSPNARVVSTTPGHEDRSTTSGTITATFNAKGEIASAEQAGDFHYQEGQRQAWAERARYNPADESYVLSGSPRMTEAESSLTADTIQLSRKTGSALAQGNVKTTYNQKPQPGGAMLSSADPVHVTGTSMTADRGGDVARFANARLWRGPDIVDAPTIAFNHGRRSLQALGDPSKRVTAAFTQIDKSGKTTPVNVTSDRLSYVDADRKAIFSGNVLMRVEGSTINAETVQALLVGRGAQSDSQAGSQLDRIVAEGNIQIQQPDRKATGSRLVYTAQDEKFVLTGSAARPPSIFDAERGEIQGNSLTFFRHDGRVLVGNGESSTTSTQTKAQDANRK